MMSNQMYTNSTKTRHLKLSFSTRNVVVGANNPGYKASVESLAM